MANDTRHEDQPYASRISDNLHLSLREVHLNPACEEFEPSGVFITAFQSGPPDATEGTND